MTPQGVRAALVGVWELVEYRDRLSDADPWYEPYGTDLTGVFHYQQDGFLSVHLCPGTDAPADAAYLGYFGRWVLREWRQEGEGIAGVVEHHMTGASASFLFEDHPDRPFFLDRDELTIGDRRTSVRRLVRPPLSN
jgi:hypothetical protein